MYIMIADDKMREMLQEQVDYYDREITHLTDQPLQLNEKGESVRSQLEPYFTEVDKHYPILFLEDGEVIGFSLITHHGYNTYFVIDDLYVIPDSRRNGKGSEAVEKLKGLMLSIEQNPVIHADVHANHPYAATFFEKQGFQITSSTDEMITLTFGSR